MIVAYGQNGEAVRPENGYPLRLVVPGFEGLSHVKWLRRIKVVDEPYQARDRKALGYSILRPNLNGKAFWFNFEMGPKSVITRPSAGLRMPRPRLLRDYGAGLVGGRRHPQGRRLDRRRTNLARRATRGAGPSTRAHAVQCPWTWDGEEAVLQSRCTDERGDVQPTLARAGSKLGVAPDFFQAPRMRVNHFNAVFPWRVTREGSVETALFS